MDSKGEIKIYQLQDGQTTIDVRLENETVWLNRNQIATLFDRDVKTIGKHINNALKEELEGEVVVAKFATTTQHGALEGKTQTHMTDYYNLEMITSVGYRVKSKRGIEFCRWANTVLKEYLVKGYAVKERPCSLAMLLYFVTKNHSFSDGNKRIAATLFLWFMNNNGILYNPDGSKRIGDNTLVALTLMIAESRTEEKDTMVKVVVNLINKKNV
ncbi:RhuM family protein [Prevotella histicola]